MIWWPRAFAYSYYSFKNDTAFLGDSCMVQNIWGFPCSCLCAGSILSISCCGSWLCLVTPSQHFCSAIVFRHALLVSSLTQQTNQNKNTKCMNSHHTISVTSTVDSGNQALLFYFTRTLNLSNWMTLPCGQGTAYKA